MNIPGKLKEARINKGYSIKHTAELVGISPQTYSKYERGITSPSLNTVGKLIRALNLDANYLLSDNDSLRNVYTTIID